LQEWCEFMTEQAQKLIGYIKRDVLRNSTIELDADTPLISSGLIDSLALVEILCEVEDVTERRIPASKVLPKDMDTINLMLATAERIGRSRQKR